MEITENWLINNGYDKIMVTDPGVTNPYVFKKTIDDLEITVGVVRPYIQIFARERQLFISMQSVTEVEGLIAAIELTEYSKVPEEDLLKF